MPKRWGGEGGRCLQTTCSSIRPSSTCHIGSSWSRLRRDPCRHSDSHDAQLSTQPDCAWISSITERDLRRAEDERSIKPPSNDYDALRPAGSDGERVDSKRYQRVNGKLQYAGSLKLLAGNLIPPRERSDLRSFRPDYQSDAQATVLSRQASLKEFARKLYAIEELATRPCLACDAEGATLELALDMRAVLQSHRIHDTGSRGWRSSHENEFSCSGRFQASYLLHQRMLEELATKLAWCTALRACTEAPLDAHCWGSLHQSSIRWSFMACTAGGACARTSHGTRCLRCET